MRIRYLFPIALFVVLFSFSANATVVEESRLAQVVSQADQSTLLVFDIDSTVLDTPQMLGSDAWYYYNVDKDIESGMSRDNARSKVFGVWRQIQAITQVKPVEADTAGNIRTAQDKGIKVIALTSRPYDIAELTMKQLDSIGVDFARQPVSKKEIDLGADVGRYEHGILFTGKLSPAAAYITADKGKALVAFLKKTKFTPAKVIFVDDKKNNVDAVDKSLASQGIASQSIRYGAADDQYKRYDPDVADVELEYFGKILNDRAARAIAKERKRR